MEQYTKEYVVAHFNECVQLHNHLDSILSEIRQDQEHTKLQEELKKYQGESKQTFEKRFFDWNEWEEVWCTHDEDFDSKCCGNDCHGGTTFYRMKGRTDLVLCNLCKDRGWKSLKYYTSYHPDILSEHESDSE